MELSMELIYKKAALDDMELLLKSRIEVLIAANKLDKTVDMSTVEQQSYEYYGNALKDGSHIAYLIFDHEVFVGTGGISFFK